MHSSLSVYSSLFPAFPVMPVHFIFMVDSYLNGIDNTCTCLYHNMYMTLVVSSTPFTNGLLDMRFVLGVAFYIEKEQQ